LGQQRPSPTRWLAASASQPLAPLEPVLEPCRVQEIMDILPHRWASWVHIAATATRGFACPGGRPQLLSILQGLGRTVSGFDRAIRAIVAVICVVFVHTLAKWYVACAAEAAHSQHLCAVGEQQEFHARCLDALRGACWHTRAHHSSQQLVRPHRMCMPPLCSLQCRSISTHCETVAQCRCSSMQNRSCSELF